MDGTIRKCPQATQIRHKCGTSLPSFALFATNFGLIDKLNLVSVQIFSDILFLECIQVKIDTLTQQRHQYPLSPIECVSQIPSIFTCLYYVLSDARKLFSSTQIFPIWSSQACMVTKTNMSSPESSSNNDGPQAERRRRASATDWHCPASYILPWWPLLPSYRLCNFLPPDIEWLSCRRRSWTIEMCDRLMAYLFVGTTTEWYNKVGCFRRYKWD